MPVPKKKKKLIVEGDYRVTAQSFPYAGRQGQYNIQGSTGVASINILDPVGRPDIDVQKVFDDEKIASAAGVLLPYTLDRVNDSLVKIMEGLAETKEMLKNTLNHPSVTVPQKEYIKGKVAIFSAIEKHVVLTAKSLDKLRIS